MEQITARPIKLGYKAVGSSSATAYNELGGILKGMTTFEDAPQSNPLEAQFGGQYGVLTRANPLSISLELIKFDIADLPNIIGGTFANGVWSPPSNNPMKFHDWVIEFEIGISSIRIPNGQVIYNMNMPDDAALGVQMTIIACKPDDGGEPYTLNGDTAPYIDYLSKKVDMQPGEYLSDIIQLITDKADATRERPYTINFYNHSKTVDWTKFTGKITWPENVYLNFVGEINWWTDVFYEGIEFDNLFETNPTDKLFIGFSFNKTNPESHKFISGLPQNLSKVFFGGLDELVEVAVDYDDMTDVDSHYGQGTLGLVFCGGDVLDNVNNNKLYKRIGDTFYDVSVDFSYVDLSAHYLKNAFLCGVDLTGADLSGVNLQGVNWSNVVSVENCNFKGADLSRGFNLPSEIDTRDKFIMVAGVNNVDANTTWIDGLSIIVDSLSGLVDANY